MRTASVALRPSLDTVSKIAESQDFQIPIYHLKQNVNDNVIATINNTQKNNKYRLCGDSNETFNYVSELAQKGLNIWKNCVGKVINRKLYKRVKFDHAGKWYMKKPEYVLENDTIQFSRTLRYKQIT